MPPPLAPAGGAVPVAPAPNKMAGVAAPGSGVTGAVSGALAAVAHAAAGVAGKSTPSVGPAAPAVASGQHQKSPPPENSHSSSGSDEEGSSGITKVSTLYRLVDETITYEYHAYEAIFATSIALYKQEHSRIRKVADELLPQMQRGGILPFEMQKRMALLKGIVAGAISKVEGFKRCLDELFDDDEAMALMSLTLLRAKPEYYQ